MEKEGVMRQSFELQFILDPRIRAMVSFGCKYCFFIKLIKGKKGGGNVLYDL